jgi:hypothetical protein
LGTSLYQAALPVAQKSHRVYTKPYSGKCAHQLISLWRQTPGTQLTLK